MEIIISNDGRDFNQAFYPPFPVYVVCELLPHVLDTNTHTNVHAHGMYKLMVDSVNVSIHSMQWY
eukprot:c26531_g1_i1 orf=1-192(-)